MGTSIRLIYIVFFSIFLLGSVFALSSLDKIKIEKIDGKYYLYELKEITTITDIEKKITKLNNYEFDMEYCLMIDGLCDMDCQNSTEFISFEDCIDMCKERWTTHCESQEYFMDEYNKKEIKRLNDKIDDFKKIK